MSKEPTPIIFKGKEKKLLVETTNHATNVLVQTMIILSIPNYIKTQATCEGYEYKLVMTRKKVKSVKRNKK